MKAILIEDIFSRMQIIILAAHDENEILGHWIMPDACVAQALLPVQTHPAEGKKHRQECRCHK
ncbi:MAG TPA: hypothetical protein VKE93_16170 [Candidatus Angelobacter sp.]|nr:hypothetical protein [Candidatus Angelobacter sp.]